MCHNKEDKEREREKTKEKKKGVTSHPFPDHIGQRGRATFPDTCPGSLPQMMPCPVRRSSGHLPQMICYYQDSSCLHHFQNCLGVLKL